MRWWGLTGQEIIAAVAIPAAFFGSVIVYILEGRKIPKLQYDEFFKEDRSVVTTVGVRNRITFFVKIINTNSKSEGRAESCTGFLEVSGQSYKTIWKDNGRSKYSFAKEALLQLFYIDKDHKTITFTNSISGEDELETSSVPYPTTEEDLTIRLESDRGHCPKPKTKNIDDIVKCAEHV